MSKRLTVEEIKDKIFDIENTIYKGYKMGELELSRNLHPIDWTLWVRYQKLLTKRESEVSNDRDK